LNERSDENLVRASRKGDKGAYALLVRRHYKHIFVACLGVVGNIEDAEDIAQEAMLKGFMQLEKLRNSSQFGPWMMKIARNLCINLVHRKQRSRQIIADQATRPVGVQSRNERLQHAIEHLPLEIRQPLVMYYFDGLSVQSVANDLNISTSAAYSRLRCAIKEMHRLLAGQGDENG
jgi:RNA polymerase sigma-70 factor (ECF subfamily)